MLKPVTDLEKYLAGEFAEEHDWWTRREDDYQPESEEGSDTLLLRRVLTLFARKGS